MALLTLTMLLRCSDWHISICSTHWQNDGISHKNPNHPLTSCGACDQNSSDFQFLEFSCCGSNGLEDVLSVFSDILPSTSPLNWSKRHRIRNSATFLRHLNCLFTNWWMCTHVITPTSLSVQPPPRSCVMHCTCFCERFRIQAKQCGKHPILYGLY